ncbi:MAG: hypothetical protein P4L99_25425 [Chthoniobacter sp.]|nr:hypothetical protein [Chthoniobacter sp.]
MKAAIDSADSFPVAGLSAIKVTIIYEDFASGTWAKRFAERLADFLECTCSLSETIWRSELLECPPLADQAARAAAECDYLIVSLHGDRVLPFAARQWIEAQLERAAERGMGLILLSDSSQAKWRVVEATRHHLRCACAMKDVAFFSHAVTAPALLTA